MRETPPYFRCFTLHADAPYRGIALSKRCDAPPMIHGRKARRESAPCPLLGNRCMQRPRQIIGKQIKRLPRRSLQGFGSDLRARL